MPFGIGPDAGITPVLDATSIDATNIYNPFGVTLQGDDPTTAAPNDGNLDLILRRFVEGGPRRFFQTVDTTYGVATLDGHFKGFNHDWYWDINGVYGNNKANQTMLGNINSHNLANSSRPERHLRRPRRAASRSTSSAVPARSPRR